MPSTATTKVLRTYLIASVLKRSFADRKSGGKRGGSMIKNEELMDKEKELIEALKNKLTEENKFRKEEIQRHREAIENNDKVIAEIEENMKKTGH